ncbi:MAG TPA: hypothetical protein VFZ65_13875 [Planctomycetota bacterium]|nr:hypothetical protein [Planctomycetota bacterium]
MSFLGLLLPPLLICGPVPLALATERHLEAEGAAATRASRLLHVVLVWIAATMALAVVLGAVGAYAAVGAAVGELLLFVVGAALWRRAPSWLPTGAEDEDDLPSRPLRRALCAVLGALFGCVVWTTLTRPVSDYDSLAYHLPHVALWFQQGSFAPMPQFRDVVSWYPYGWEALAGLSLFAGAGDQWIAAPQLLAWVLLGLAVARCALWLGSRRLDAVAAAALLLCLPTVWQQLNTLHVDLPVAALFAAALAVLPGAVRSGVRSTHSAVLGLALGAMAGTKASGLVYAALVLAAWAALRLGRARGDGPSPASSGSLSSPRALLLGHAAVGVLVGGFWYARNLVAVGNPLGGVQVRVLGRVWFAGPATAKGLWPTTLWATVDLRDAVQERIVLDAAWRALGPPFVLLAALGALGALLGPTRSPSWRLRGQAALMTVVAAAAAALFVVTPFSARVSAEEPLSGFVGEQVRFAQPALAALAALAALGARRAALPVWLVGGAALVAMVMAVEASAVTRLLVLSLDSVPMPWLIGALAAALGAVPVLRALRRRSSGRVVRLLALPALVLLCVALSTVTHAHHAAMRAPIQGVVVQFLREHVPPGERIGYASSHRTYLLYGADLSREVVYVEAMDDFAAWTAEIERQDLRWLAVGPVFDERGRRLVARLLTEGSPFERRFGDDPERDVMVFAR